MSDFGAFSAGTALPSSRVEAGVHEHSRERTGRVTSEPIVHQEHEHRSALPIEKSLRATPALMRLPLRVLCKALRVTNTP